MRVLHIINSLGYGGAEKLLVDSIPKYIEKGISIEIFVLDNSRTSFYEELEELHQVKIHFTKKRYNIYNPVFILILRKFIVKYDVIHVHLFPTVYWLSLSSFFLKYNTRFYLTEHNTENRRRKIALFKYLDRLLYKKFDKIIAISDSVKINLESHLGNTYRNIIVINNGIDTKKIDHATPYSKRELSIPEESVVLIQVSSFTLQKDQDTLIRAVALLGDNVHLLLVGDGPTKKSKIELSESLNLEKRIHFLGYRTDVPRLIKTADISVLSSHYEGFGLAIVEGMAAANPCLGSDVPGLSQIVKNAGIVFKPSDHIELKKSLDKLISNKIYFNQIKVKCFNRAKQYSITLMIDQYINLYLHGTIKEN